MSRWRTPLGISQITLALIHEAEEQELTSAVDAGTVGFMARMMVQVTMPHSMPTSDRFVRTNGRFTIQMVAGDLSFGLHTVRFLAWFSHG